MSDAALTPNRSNDVDAPLSSESRIRRVVTVYVPLACFLFILLFPFYWMTITAIKPDNELLDYKNTNPFWVVHPTFEHIRKLLFETDYPRWLMTTMGVSIAATVISIFASVLAAYAIQRLRFRGSTYVGLAIYLAYLVPPTVLFLPLAELVFQFGLFDTPMALILTYPTFLIPFCTWLLIGYFKSIPFEAGGVRPHRRSHSIADTPPHHATARSSGAHLGGHLRLHSFLERIHLRARLYLQLRKQDGPGRSSH